MKKIKYRAFSLALILTLALACAQPAFATATVIKAAPAAVEVKAARNFTVPIEAVEAASVAGLVVTVSYTAPQKLSPIGVALGSGWPAGTSMVFETASVDSDSSKVVVAIASKTNAVFAARGELFSIQFGNTLAANDTFTVTAVVNDACDAALASITGGAQPQSLQYTAGATPTQTGPLEPNLNAGSLKVEGSATDPYYLNHISPSLTPSVAALEAQLNTNGLQILTAPTAIKTGATMRVGDSEDNAVTYTLVLNGDTNGDGNIRSSDIVSISRHCLEISLLTGANLQAARLREGASRVTGADAVIIQRHILEIATI